MSYVARLRFAAAEHPAETAYYEHPLQKLGEWNGQSPSCQSPRDRVATGPRPQGISLTCGNGDEVLDTAGLASP